MNPLHIAAHGLPPRRHGAVDPGTNLDPPAPGNVARETRGDLDRQIEVAFAHPPVEIGIIGNRRALDEVPGAGEIEGIVAAEGGLVTVQYRKAEIFHIKADAIAHHEHQDDAAYQRQGQPDGIAAQLQCFTPGLADHAARVEQTPPAR